MAGRGTLQSATSCRPWPVRFSPSVDSRRSLRFSRRETLSWVARESSPYGPASAYEASAVHAGSFPPRCRRAADAVLCESLAGAGIPAGELGGADEGGRRMVVLRPGDAPRARVPGGGAGGDVPDAAGYGGAVPAGATAWRIRASSRGRCCWAAPPVEAFANLRAAENAARPLGRRCADWLKTPGAYGGDGGGTAWARAVFGDYGVVALAARRGTRELSIRLALGATKRPIVG